MSKTSTPHPSTTEALELIRSGRTHEARALLVDLLHQTPADVQARDLLARIYLNAGAANEALEQYYEMLRLNPSDKGIRSRIRLLHTKSVPQWHYGMLNDTDRNEKYRKALEAIVTPEMSVLEIGTGSGLLAMLAARAGARHVYSCEQSLPLAIVARQIIARNNLSDKITVINKWSTDLQIGIDLPAKANLFVAEIFGSALVNEHMAKFYNDARARLLTPQAVMVPQAATVYGMMLESAELRKEVRVTSACEFDLTPFNALYDTPSFPVALAHVPHTPLTKPFPIFNFDFSHELAISQQRLVTVEAIREGTCHGIALWFSLELSEGVQLESSPDSLGTHWRQELQIFEFPFKIIKGHTYQIEIQQVEDRIVCTRAGEQ